MALSVTKKSPAELAAARRSIAYERHVGESVSLQMGYLYDETWKDPSVAIAFLEKYAAGIHEELQEGSRGMQSFIADTFDNDLELLTRHAARIRTTEANILLLRGGIVPALKMDGENPRLRSWALETQLYIRASVEAIRNLML